MNLSLKKLRTFFAGLVLHLLILPAHSQDKPVLFASMVRSKGYVVGAKLAASGLYRYEGDTVWTHTGWNIPRVSGISFDPTNPEIIFLACGNGCLRTLDGGKSWRITTDWRVTEAQDVAVDPNAPENVYLATAYGVWRTDDRGEKWVESNTGLSKKYTQTIEVDRTQAGRVLAGTEGGLYLSTDGAQPWSLVGPKEVTILDLDQSPTSPHVWLAGTQQNGVLLSDDGGKTWRFAQGPIAGASIYATTIEASNPQHMAAAGWDTGVFLSRDGGKTWKQHKKGLPVPHFYEVSFEVNRPGSILAATVEEGIYRSDDWGGSWQYAGLYGALVFDMVFIEGKAK
jgi:photosystem II stability/assembly factor-like uncharacterized protein